MRRYLIHPGDYAIGENEKCYGDMAAKGWKLRRRGAFLSSFERCEPQQLRYRIELASPALFDDDLTLPEEQRSLYEESGWQFVTRCGLVNVFCAPAGSDAPEFYSDPVSQAATLKALRRSYLLSWLPVTLSCLLWLLFAAGMRDDSFSQALTALKAQWTLELARNTAMMLLLCLLVVWGIVSNLYGAIHTMRLCRRLKKGHPLDHAPSGRHLPDRLFAALCWLGMLCMLLLMLWQWKQTQHTALPAQSDDPYLLLQELGFEGEPHYWSGDEGNDVSQIPSLAARVWDARQSLTCGDDFVWLYQEVFLFSSPQRARDIVPALMVSSTFGQSQEAFTPLSVEGLDGAWQSGLDFVALKGNCVSYLTFSEYEGESQALLLETLSQKWAKVLP